MVLIVCTGTHFHACFMYIHIHVCVYHNVSIRWLPMNAYIWGFWFTCHYSNLVIWIGNAYVTVAKLISPECRIYALVNWVSVGSDNGLAPFAIIQTNAGLLSIGPLGTNLCEILIKIHKFSPLNMHLKMSFAKWRPLPNQIKLLLTDYTVYRNVHSQIQLIIHMDSQKRVNRSINVFVQVCISVVQLWTSIFELWIAILVMNYAYQIMDIHDWIIDIYNKSWKSIINRFCFSTVTSLTDNLKLWIFIMQLWISIMLSYGH